MFSAFKDFAQLGGEDDIEVIAGSSIPLVSGQSPLLYADFAAGIYWYNGTLYSTLAAWLTAFGGTFTRASSGSYTNANGVLQPFGAGSGVLRTDYDGLTKVAKGYLAESSSTNLLLKSGQVQVDGVNWQIAVGTISNGNVIAAPDGTVSAAYFQRGGVGGPYYVTTPILSKTAASQYWVASIYAKLGLTGTKYMALRMQQLYPSYVEAVFDLSAGTIATPAFVSNAATNPFAAITPVGNGWYRCVVSCATDTNTNIQLLYSFNSNNTMVDGIDVVANSDGYAWGAQLENSSTVVRNATSYIPTTVASVTRAADSLSAVPIGVTVPDPFTVFFAGDSADASLSFNYNNGFALRDGTGNNVTTCAGFNSNFLYADNYGAGLGIFVSSTIVAAVRNADYRVASAHAAAQVGDTFYVNGAASSGETNAAGTMAAATNLFIGTDQLNRYLQGHVRKVGVWRVAGSGADLQRLTA
jgi:hypothetical protein